MVGEHPPPGDEIELDEEYLRILAEVWAIPLDVLQARAYSERDDPLGLGSDAAAEQDIFRRRQTEVTPPLPHRRVRSRR
jgi:hypothetical protein